MPKVNDITYKELKAKLKKLIEKSEAIKSIPQPQQKKEIDAMLSASPEQMRELIKVFEEEQAELDKINEEFLQHEDEINALLAEIKQIKVAADRAERIAKEKKSRVKETKKADMLLKKLDDIL